MEIELDILWLDEDNKSAQDAGVEIPYEDCVTRKHTFYSISFIRPSNDKGYTEIASNGEEYITKMEYNLLRDVISGMVNFNIE